MNRLLKAILRAVWRLTTPIRRPVVRKLDGHVVALLVQAIRGPILERLDAVPWHEDGLPPSSRPEPRLQEMSLAINGLIREVVRLQMQVEVLQQSIDDASLARGGLTVVGGEEAHGADPMAEERLRVG